MKKNITRRTLTFIITLIIALAVPLTAFAETQTFEFVTRSALLVDRSGSIKDQEEVNSVVSTMDISEFDFVGYFDDSQISLDPSYAGGGNSSICQVIDDVAKLGYTHITVLTDGQQWPADYSCLGIYSDLDLTIRLVGDKTEDAQELSSELESRMTNSSLKVVKPDGTEKTILDDYTAETFTVEIPEQSQPEDTGDNESTTIINEHGKCYWWVALILAILISALFDFIHELITRRRNQTPGGIGTGTVGKPIPKKAVHAIENGAGVLADFSGSMAKQQKATKKACKKAKTDKSIICFGDGVTEVEVDNMSSVKAGGQTPGWEALELAAAKGWDELVVVSDLGFNGKYFEASSFGKKFKKITVVVPRSYDRNRLAEMQQIAEDVEVLPL